MDKERVKSYLTRLGLDTSVDLPCEPSLELLKRLQYAHVTRIAYENLDILQGKPLFLDAVSAVDKITLRKRGGYCFELNLAFGWLLRQLGYEVGDRMARYLRGAEGIPVRRHRVLEVSGVSGESGGGFMAVCDVGVGERAPRYPLLMNDGVIQEQFGESYRLESDAFLGHVVSDLHNGSFERFYSFTDEPQLDIDYIMPSYYCEKSPDSPFNKDYMLSIKTCNGRKTISGHVFRVFENEKVTERLLDDSELLSVMKNDFFLEV